MAENADKPKTSYLHCKMSADMLDAIDRIAAHYGQNDRSSTIRLMIVSEERRIASEATPPKKSARSAR